MAETKTRQQRQRPATVRLSEVAARAGCSTATVSRVLNMPSAVNAESRQRVLDAIRALGYVRNGSAGALRSSRTKIIGAVVPTLDHAIYASLLGTLQSRASEGGYSLLVTTSGFQVSGELQQARLLVERGAEALVLVGHTHSPDLYALLDAKRIPYINTYTYRPDSSHASVGFENHAASAQIARFLADIGHRRLAMIVGFRKDNDRVSDRIAGTRQAFADYRVTIPDSLIIEEPYSIEGGRDGLRRILQSGARPTAVICTSDVLAFGALVECDDRGIAVPDDLSVAGFDDLEFAAHFKPALTTVRVPSAEMGLRAADYLLARLAGAPHPLHCPLETDLILRRSTARPVDAQSPTRRRPKSA
jgi:LacI family transcriptional regulator